MTGSDPGTIRSISKTSTRVGVPRIGHFILSGVHLLWQLSFDLWHFEAGFKFSVAHALFWYSYSTEHATGHDFAIRDE